MKNTYWHRLTTVIGVALALTGSLAVARARSSAQPQIATKHLAAKTSYAAQPAAGPAPAYAHPNMDEAMKHLQAAAAALNRAKRNFYGHRYAALTHTNQAIKEIQAGIAEEAKKGPEVK
ncbi:MAG TPA: hypothetical protein VGW33_13135 [Terriglobia bacterium]|nr:hypothetical protein [Terriglobia bacterium]